jgi:hypothetical protein
MIIDLGYAEPLEEPERPLDTAIGHLRLIGIGLLALVCLVTFGGASRPPLPAFTQVGLIPWNYGSLPDDRLPTVAGGLVLSSVGDEVIAYHVDGRLAWHSRLTLDPSGDPGFYDVGEWDGGPLLTRITLPRLSSRPQPARLESVALDPVTGKERWRVEGSPRRIGDLVMVSGDPWTSVRGVRVYRSLPDDLLWAAEPARMTAVEAATDTLMTITDTGLLTDYQLSTGSVRRSVQLTLPHAAPDPADEELSMRLFGDRLILRAMGHLGPQPDEKVLSYDRATLRQIASVPLDGLLGVEECGPVICANNFEQMYFLDKDTLTELWHTQIGDFPTWTTAGMLVQFGGLRLVDERTGQTRVDVSGWTIAYNRGRQSGQPVPALMTRRVGTRTYVARATTQTLEVLGVIPQGLNECQSHLDLLLCRTDSSGTAVWRLAGTS